jgi:Na+-transporting methylmalonyl-CoA/oxaloacetate decarboxylase beta subunit
LVAFDPTQFFPGILSFFQTSLTFSLIRIGLIAVGAFMVWSGYKKITEPLIMIPMGIGLLFVNTAIFFIPLTAPLTAGIANPHVDPLIGSNLTDFVNNTYQSNQANSIFWLQPIYSLTFSNGLIACLVFLGIGAITDLDFLIARPFTSMILAAFAELGTVVTFPIAIAAGLNPGQAASVAMVGGADGPMVLFTSLNLARDIFVPVTVVAYIYLSILYLFQGKLNELTIPEKLRATFMDSTQLPKISQQEKFLFSVAAGTVLSLLFPVASPLFAAFFLGNAIKESGVERFKKLADEMILSVSTLFLGFVLGMLLTPTTVLDSRIYLILLLGITALILSAIGGNIGGIIAYYYTKGKVNPLLGSAAVSCVPTSAKIAQLNAS